MLKLGLDSLSYRLKMSEGNAADGARWLLERVAALGLDGCHFDPCHLDGWNTELVYDIGTMCRDMGLYLELGSGGFDFERLSKRLELSAEVGARVMRTFIGGERWETPESRIRELMGYTTDNFRLLAPVAEQTRVVLALENHEELMSTELVEILDSVDSPWVRALVDTGNALPVSEDPVECVRRLAPYAAGSHLKDWRHWLEDGRSRKCGCALGQGDVPIDRVYPILRNAKPDMPITMEIASGRDCMPGSLEEEDSNVLKSIEYVRALESALV